MDKTVEVVGEHEKSVLNVSLTPARLIKRYKRFLADVILENGEEITVHCPNTGSMKNCGEPGDQVWLSFSNNPKRKYSYTWELVAVGKSKQSIACINTNRANQLVALALESKLITELADYPSWEREVKYGEENSRIDFLLTNHVVPQPNLLASQPNLYPDVYLEVKSVTLGLNDEGLGAFPDAVSKRGTKHLRELISMKRQGHRAVLLFCVCHTGIQKVMPAVEIDPVYAQTLQEAYENGVEVLAYGVDFNLDQEQWSVSEKLPVLLNGDC